MRKTATLLALLAPLSAAQSFTNWENPHVHPLDLTADGALLLAVNTPDNRLEVFDASCGTPAALESIPVGVDPVSVRARGNTQAWVVNHISDSVSVVDLATRRVVATLPTDDEPCDVVFAGSPERAFVSCSQTNTVLVFDPADLSLAPQRVTILGEDPRAMAVSADGSEVYVAVFESGNGTTVLGGGSTMAGGFPPNVVNALNSPYGGTNPPPNDGGSFTPAIDGGLPAPPGVGLIVRRDGGGQWMDDNGGNWTNQVSGSLAGQSGRPVGWTLLDHDVAILDANTLSVSYADGLMNLCMALSVNPQSGEVYVVGTDAINEIRFEPNLNGVFLRVEAAFFDPSSPAGAGIVDLNPHLDYTSSTVAQNVRDQSLGDPRGIAWNATGTRAFVSGMGSNNLVVIDAAGTRAGLNPTIEVGEGPTGVVVDDADGLVYVLNKFEGSLSVVSLAGEAEVARVPFFDPTPTAIKDGRVRLYGTHETSGTGIVSCGSCHIDSRMDRLAWDLGNPEGAMKSVAGQNQAANIPGLNGGFEDFHPMKGPMTTQTLQDIIGKEPLHWRGDRDGIEEFNGAFVGLLGDDTQLTPTEMQEFEDFLATIHFPPNPFRNLDNTLPTSLPLSGHFTTGRFGPAGLPLPNGNAVNGLALYRPPNLLDGGAVACSTCHAMPIGIGTNWEVVNLFSPMQPIPPGPDGELHHALVSQDGSTNVSMKIPQLRNMYDKVGMELTQLQNLAGFGFLHDGSVDSLARFVNEPVFTTASVQQTADLVAFMLAFAGSDLPTGSSNVANLEPPGTLSLDTHAAVGQQVTLVDAGSPGPGQLTRINELLGLADAGVIGLVVHGHAAGIARGWAYAGGGMFQSDRAAETTTAAALQAAAQPGSERTYTAVVAGSQTRLGLDRDEDGFFDRDELDAGSKPDDAASVPGGCGTPLPAQPTDLALRARSRSSLHISWLDASSNETGFVVERAVAGPGASFQVVATLPAGSIDFEDTGLACGTSYLYRVSATNCAGGVLSSCITASTRACFFVNRRGGLGPR